MHAGTLARGVARVPSDAANLPVVTRTRAAASFGEYFEALMKASGFANREMLAKVSGVDATTMGRWVKDGRPPTLDKLLAVAPHLGVRAGDLMVAAGLATREDLGMVGTPGPTLPPLPDVIIDIITRLAAPQTPRRRQALVNHLVYALEFFDRVVDEKENQPREPRMRNR